MYIYEKAKRITNTKIPLGVFVVVLLFILYSPLVYGNPLEEGIVTAERLNVRQSPSTSAEIVGQLPKDSSIKINEYMNDWYNITYEDLNGWVFGDYVKTKETAASVDPTTSVEGLANPSESADINNEDTKKKGVVTAGVLNVREGPGTSAKILSKLENGMEVEILDEADNEEEYPWYQVNYISTKGWVSGEYISFKNEPIDEGTVNVSVANVRIGPGLTSNVITQLERGNKVVVYSWSGDWYKIKLDDSSFAWVFSDLVTTGKELASRSALGSRSGSDGDRATDLRIRVVNYTKKYLGVRYVWGGTSPNGFDCSGLVQYVYKQFGIKLNRVAADQAKQGTKVTKAQLRPGDLVFFNAGSGGGIDHVGMYIGNNQFIHAASGRGKVVIDPINQGFYNGRLVTAKRIIK